MQCQTHGTGTAQRKRAADTSPGRRSYLRRASRYKLDNEDDPAFIEAALNATWERFRPFDLYKPTSTTRDVGAGPHLLFLRLKHVMEEQPSTSTKPVCSLRNMAF